MLASDLEALGATLGVLSPTWRADPRILKIYRPRLARNPGWDGWLMRGIVLRHPHRRLAGHIGFHEGPDTTGTVEIGYTVFPKYRNRGIAAEAAAGMIAWAGARGVRRVIASIGPANAPSLRIAARLGFVLTGSRWDDDDGEELVFELSL